MARRTTPPPYGPDSKAPRVEGSDTSAEAAEFIEPHRAPIRDRILALLKCEISGLCDWEIEERLDLKHTTASARRRELVLDGLVVDSGKRRETPSGCKATVWRAVRKDEQITLDAPSQLDVIRGKLRKKIGRIDTLEGLDEVWQTAKRVLDDQGGG